MSIRELAVQVDERLADLYHAAWSHEQTLMISAERLRSAAGQEREITGTNRYGRPEYGNWIGTIDDALATVDAMPEPTNSWSRDANAKRFAAEYRFDVAALRQIKTEAAELDAVWREEGRWNRAFLVLNSNGHVHNGMTCSTCFESTRYEWLTAYSAADEAEIVAAAGETACTVCYPTAPAEVLNRPANLVSKTQAEKAAAKAERDAAKAERDAKRKAKAPTATGEPLVVPQDEWGHNNATLNTEVTARKTWNGIEDRKRSTWGRPATQQQIDAQQVIEEALAGKYGVSPAEMRDQLTARYSKRR